MREFDSGETEGHRPDDRIFGEAVLCIIFYKLSKYLLLIFTRSRHPSYTNRKCLIRNSDTGALVDWLVVFTHALVHCSPVLLGQSFLGGHAR